MIENLVTFFGEQGRRYAEVCLLVTCVVPTMYVVDMIDEMSGSHLTKFFTTEEEAEKVAMDYAFKGETE